MSAASSKKPSSSILFSEEFNPDAALYFVRDGQFLFRWREETGQLSSKFLLADDVQAAFANAERDSGWIDPGVVRFGGSASGDWFLYLAPSGKTPITLQLNEKILQIVVQLPPILMLGSGDGYRAYAYPHKGAFNPEKELYAAPLPNVNCRTGGICWGLNLPPRAHHSVASKAWKLFIESPFSGHLADGSSREFRDDVRARLLKLDKEQPKVYPKEDLIEVHMDANDLIRRLNDRSS